LVYRARRGRESFKEGFEVTQGEKGTLLKSAVEATSLGLKNQVRLKAQL